MANLIENFINDVLTAEHLTLSNRRLAIRNKITEYENLVRSNGANDAEIQSVLSELKDRAFAEITRQSPKNIPTPTAEFYQDVSTELSLRARTSIKEIKNGTFQVNVDKDGSKLPHVAKDDFKSLKAAQDWRDSDQGAAVVKAILEK